MAHELFNLPDAESLLATKAPVLGFPALPALWITQGIHGKSLLTYILVHYLDFLPCPFYRKGRQKTPSPLLKEKKPDSMLENLGPSCSIL